MKAWLLPDNINPGPPLTAQFYRTDTLRRDVHIADEPTEGTNSQTFIINYGRLNPSDLFLVNMLKQEERKGYLEREDNGRRHGTDKDGFDRVYDRFR